METKLTFGQRIVKAQTEIDVEKDKTGHLSVGYASKSNILDKVRTILQTNELITRIIEKDEGDTLSTSLYVVDALTPINDDELSKNELLLATKVIPMTIFNNPMNTKEEKNKPLFNFGTVETYVTRMLFAKAFNIPIKDDSIDKAIVKQENAFLGIDIPVFDTKEIEIKATKTRKSTIKNEVVGMPGNESTIAIPDIKMLPNETTETPKKDDFDINWLDELVDSPPARTLPIGTLKLKENDDTPLDNDLLKSLDDLELK